MCSILPFKWDDLTPHQDYVVGYEAVLTNFIRACDHEVRELEVNNKGFA